MICKRRLFAVFVGSCGLLLSSMTSHAENKQFDFNQQIEMLKAAKSVTVSIRDPARGAFYGWVKDHPKYACTYSSKAQADISQLIQVLKNAKVRKIPINESHLPIVQVEVYFTLPGDIEAQFLFGREYINEETVDGEFNSAQKVNAVAVLANRVLIKNLLNLTKQLAVNESTEKDVMSTKEDFERQNWQRIHSINESCDRMLNTQFYQSYQSKNQTCGTTTFNMPLPDICPSGWKP